MHRKLDIYSLFIIELSVLFLGCNYRQRSGVEAVIMAATHMLSVLSLMRPKLSNAYELTTCC